MRHLPCENIYAGATSRSSSVPRDGNHRGRPRARAHSCIARRLSAAGPALEAAAGEIANMNMNNMNAQPPPPPPFSFHSASWPERAGAPRAGGANMLHRGLDRRHRLLPLGTGPYYNPGLPGTVPTVQHSRYTGCSLDRLAPFVRRRLRWLRQRDPSDFVPATDGHSSCAGGDEPASDGDSTRAEAGEDEEVSDAVSDADVLAERMGELMFSPAQQSFYPPLPAAAAAMLYGGTSVLECEAARRRWILLDMHIRALREGADTNNNYNNNNNSDYDAPWDPYWSHFNVHIE
ncbi:hypothetical protein F5Y14DRAFT_97753 [Nemania sp. NC0429]|nr:hypothetical protein F5Y14DRAFT_97753 [Nemania sp. NC0429]